MNKELIQQLLDDDETRCLIADTFGQLVDDAVDDVFGYDDMMINALNKLDDILVVGDMITIEVSDYMWVRGNYLHTNPDGQLDVMSGDLSAWCKKYTGRRVELVVKGEAK